VIELAGVLHFYISYGIADKRSFDMLPIINSESYQDGQVIYEEGSYGDWLYRIESGQVELSKNVMGQHVVVDVLCKGEIFGELAFLANIPRTATAKAKGETILGVIDRAFLDEEYNKTSQYFRLIIKSVALRLEKTTDALVKSKLP
jgi:CRP-like cAMP-binding protein